MSLRGKRDTPESTPVGPPVSRHSAIGPIGSSVAAPDLVEALQAIADVRRATSRAISEERILAAFVQALEDLFPGVAFAARIAASAANHAVAAQASTHPIQEASADDLTLSDGALHLAGLTRTTRIASGIRIVHRYEPMLELAQQEALSDALGTDAPLLSGNEVIGVIAAEHPARLRPPANLRDCLLLFSGHLSAALESGRLRQQALHLRDYLDKLLEHASVPVLVMAKDRSIRVASDAFTEITKHERGDVIGSDLLELVPVRERVRLLAAFTSATRGRTVPPMEIQIPRDSGTAARLSIKLAPVLDAEEEVVGVVAIGRDLTEVRELEHQVLHAERLATLGHLAAGIVHEINNPLTSISVYGEYLLNKLRNTGAEEADQERVRRILRGADRILRFTKNVLAYARPSRQEPQRLSVNEIVDESLVFCEHVIQEAQVRVVRDYGQNLPKVFAVRDQLHQVFVNLITNACNATNGKGDQIIAQTRYLGDGSIAISIQDNGVGISDVDLKRVFEPFFTTKRRGKGTGLGLSIVRNIVEQHNGHIDVESVLGSGTTITVTLPSASITS